MASGSEKKPLPVVNRLRKKQERKITVSVSESAFKNIKKQLDYLHRSNSVLASTVKTAEDFVVFHIEHLTSMSKGSGISVSGAPDQNDEEVLWKVPSLSDERDLIFETFKDAPAFEEVSPVNKSDVDFAYGVDKEDVFRRLEGLSIQILEDGEMAIKQPDPETDIVRTFNDGEGLETFDKSVFKDCYIRVNPSEDTSKSGTNVVCPKNASPKYGKEEVVDKLLNAVDRWDITPEDAKNSGGAIELSDEVRSRKQPDDDDDE